MPFSRNQTNPRRNTFLALAGAIESRLRDIYASKHEKEGLTQQAIADKLGIGRSVVNRRLKGSQNMTTEAIADMVWALGQCIEIKIYDPQEKCDNHKSSIFIENTSLSAPVTVIKSAGAWLPKKASVLSSGASYEQA